MESTRSLGVRRNYLCLAVPAAIKLNDSPELTRDIGMKKRSKPGLTIVSASGGDGHALDMLQFGTGRRLPRNLWTSSGENGPLMLTYTAQAWDLSEAEAPSWNGYEEGQILTTPPSSTHFPESGAILLRHEQLFGASSVLRITAVSAHRTSTTHDDRGGQQRRLVKD